MAYERLPPQGFMKDPRIRGRLQTFINRRAGAQPRQVGGQDHAVSRQGVNAIQGRQTTRAFNNPHRMPAQVMQNFYRRRPNEQPGVGVPAQTKAPPGGGYIGPAQTTTPGLTTTVRDPGPAAPPFNPGQQSLPTQTIRDPGPVTPNITPSPGVMYRPTKGGY